MTYKKKVTKTKPKRKLMLRYLGIYDPAILTIIANSDYSPESLAKCYAALGSYVKEPVDGN